MASRGKIMLWRLVTCRAPNEPASRRNDNAVCNKAVTYKMDKPYNVMIMTAHINITYTEYLFSEVA